MSQENDPLAAAYRMKERIAKIKEDPGRALFSDFTGRSPGGVTASVDLLGRLKRIEIRPGALYEGAEPWLIEEIMAAYREAVRAANYLDFDTAELARELDQAPALQERLRQDGLRQDGPQQDRQERREPERVRPARTDDDDDVDQGGFLQR